MKRIIFLAVLFCLLASASQLNAQLIIRNSGHAEIGVNHVVVQSGVVYELEASGTVTLQDGFKVEKGATFAVYRSSF